MILRWFGRSPPPDLLDDRLWASVCWRSPLLWTLPAEQLAALRGLAGRFLQRKRLHPVDGLRLTPLRRALVATQCCLPLLQLGETWMDGWSDLIVYPGQFRVRRHEQDEDGLVHEWDDELAGEAWERGPVVLSFADVLADLRWPQAGFNVAIHEIAHTLDARDGAMDGVPPLPGERRRQWINDFQAAFDGFRAALDAGAEPLIDDYAAESPDEFFAVCSEYHYTAPDLLQQAFPAVAAQLADFYGPSPLLARG